MSGTIPLEFLSFRALLVPIHGANADTGERRGMGVHRCR